MLLKTAATEYSVRRLREDDTDRVITLIEACLGKSEIPRSLEFWNWKHFQNPFGSSFGLVAEQNEEIIGLRIFLTWKWLFQGQQVMAVRAVDTATHPDWRGKGIFSQLTTNLLELAKQDGFAFVFNTPNESSRPGYLKMGWKTVTKLPLWIYPLKPLRMISRLISVGAQLIAPAHDKSRQHEPEGQVSEVLQNAPVEECLCDLRKDTRFHTARNLDYLLWRYADVPAFSYEAKSRTTPDGSALVIFRRKIRRGVRELSISEILCSSGNGVIVAEKLLNEILNSADVDYAIALAAEDTTEEQALKRAGFLHVPRIGPIFTVRNLAIPDSLQLLTWENWRCSIGDFEVF